MKKLIFASAIMLWAFNIEAQVTIPNSSFEHWEINIYGRMSPVNWYTPPGVLRTADSYSGQYALEYHHGNPTGRVFNTTFSEDSYYKPIKFSFWYKSNVPIDSFLVGVEISNIDQNCRNSYVGLFLDSTSVFRLAEYILEYSPYVDCKPVNFRIEMFNESNIYDSSSYFIIDDLKFTTNFEGNVFYDLDSNNIQSANEHGIQGQVLLIEPLNEYVSTNEHGKYAIHTDTGNYTVIYQANPNWTVTNNTYSRMINVNNLDDIIEDIDFGIYPINDVCDSKIFISSSVNRCNTISDIWINYQNSGTVSNNGSIKVVLDPLLEFSFSNPSPLQIIGDTLHYDFSALMPGEIRKIEIQVLNPDWTLIGSPLTSYASINTCINKSAKSTGSVICSYDPNDKLVTPGEGENGYVLHDTQLQYTIRFQNTGNDTAFKVIIRDTLHENLNPLTLKIIGSSHPMTWKIVGKGIVIFSFNNIHLPDSNVNLVGSNGYVSYVISPREDLQDNDVVTNRAGIYFDSNPPIITNTTISTFVSEIPLNVSTKKLKDNNIVVFPNPADKIVYFKLEDDSNFITKVELIDITGKIILSNSDSFLELHTISKGMCFYKAYLRDGSNSVGKIVIK